MRKVVLFFCLSLFLSFTTAQTTITVMDSVIFYDGYAKLVVDTMLPKNILKHRNDLFARKLTAAELASIGTSLRMRVVFKALCDNYDRIASVNLALVPKGQNAYNPDSVQRMELGRFITPFMSKNIQPDTVSYAFNIDNIAELFKDKKLSKTYDFWMELYVFGVPYAAQKEVSGCSDRNDVFCGKLELTTNRPSHSQHSNILIPLLFNHGLNNYELGATDTIGLTTKQITFDVPYHLKDATLFLITSNHGSNEGGEEYIRRNHLVYVDGMLRLTFKPGRMSCEPFRRYNTQRNGIYGKSPKSDAEWQSFSNWCPGDVIDTRRIDLGPVSAGKHTFMIQVPSAVFEGEKGTIPLSLYLQGKRTKR
jgi:hypothetical protein